VFASFRRVRHQRDSAARGSFRCSSV
jgi:hypothetical protein